MLSSVILPVFTWIPVRGIKSSTARSRAIAFFLTFIVKGIGLHYLIFSQSKSFYSISTIIIMKVIDGRAIAKEMEKEIGEKAKGKKIKIATVVIEGNSESWLFARLKDKACKRVGIEHEIIGLENVSQERAEEEIKKLSEDETITGINIQLPLPPSIDYNSLVKKIDVRKDIEGMHPSNLGNLMLGREDMIPCTPKAVLKILEHEGIELKGKNVVIINHSNIIGKPLAILLLNRNSTVSVCHVYTQN
ncbi:MAG TPA: bifunctional 5,10-methylenetetrahydrofolate dehydrogenase/5,10-methenyltetrahydrofolate cyclohydrolase, partial [Thermoplasmatales archaeon]|nr:bifunctional 5,10-methylenetetrahydrofolate dehydrogenase/5,10-methenyltetrahydrofolate cyclohydrolase [Thermoplasmatales archaeon]